jgi:hypothetical protein
MTRRPGILATVGIVACILASRDAAAHQLDEYLQATRIALARSGVALELDLTPGVAVARSVFALIDADGDGSVSVREIEAYARQVLDDLSLQVDGRAYPLSLTGAESPAWTEMRDGIGAIRITASADVPLGAAGSHRVRYENAHRPDIGVYLANVLVPSAREISIVRQARDAKQRRFDLDVAVASRSSGYGWVALELIVVAVLLVRRWR